MPTNPHVQNVNRRFGVTASRWLAGHFVSKGLGQEHASMHRRIEGRSAWREQTRQCLLGRAEAYRLVPTLAYTSEHRRIETGAGRPLLDDKAGVT